MINLFGELKEKFKLEPAVIEDNSKDILFIGDIHGDLDTIDTIKENLNEYDKIVCLGDYVDRGVQDTEVSQEIAKLKLKANNLVLLAGNHDACSEVSPRDWKDRLENKFGLKKAEEIENAYVRTFQEAPIAYINPRYKLLAIHGFIPLEKEYWKVSEWEKVNSTENKQRKIDEKLSEKYFDAIPAHDRKTPAEYQIIWNDPELTGHEPGRNERGYGIFIISNKDTSEFMKENNLDRIVRSHEPRINKIFKLEDKEIINIGSTKAYRTEPASYVLPDAKIYPI